MSNHGIRLDSKLVTEGVPENNGEVSGVVAANPNINQLITQKKAFNSMAESVNNQILLPLEEKLERFRRYSNLSFVLSVAD